MLLSLYFNADEYIDAALPSITISTEVYRTELGINTLKLFCHFNTLILKQYYKVF